MKIIIGLGNPGKKYQKTWHNIGFLILDKFQKKENFPAFKISKKCNALISEKKINNEKIILFKPQTYMNESGKAVKKIIDFYKASEDKIIIVHDDVDLLREKIKISKARGSAGHKGIESIFKETNKQGFVRIRIGINPSFKKTKKAEDIVLKKFIGEEENTAKKIIKKGAEAIKFLLEKGVEKTMTKYNV